MTVGGIFLIVVGSLALYFFAIGPLISLLVCRISHTFYDGYGELVTNSIFILVFIFFVSIALYGIFMFISLLIAQWNAVV